MTTAGLHRPYVAGVTAAVMVASVVCAASVPQADGAIRHGKRMHGLTLGMTAEQVRKKLGKPDSVTQAPRLGTGQGRRYHYNALRLFVYVTGEDRNDATVWGLRTSDRKERMRNGAGVGTSEKQLKRLLPRIKCSESGSRGYLCILYTNGGPPQTEFVIKKGRASAVQILHVFSTDDVSPPPPPPQKS